MQGFQSYFSLYIQDATSRGILNNIERISLFIFISASSFDIYIFYIYAITSYISHTREPYSIFP